MQLGIFARIFPRPDVESVLDAVQAYGLTCLQFNTLCAGLAPLPDHIPPEVVRRVRTAMNERKLTMTALSGTFNMIHPDPDVRTQGLRSLSVLAANARALGTDTLTLCTGTRNPDNMWRAHPQNNSPEAWSDLIRTMAGALQIADDNGVCLVVEPEVSNVIDSARKARNLLDEMASPRLKIVMDGANLYPLGGLARQHEIMDEAFDLLGADIVMAHAKDISQDGAAGHEAAGTGLLDYDYYMGKLLEIGFEGGLVLHSLSEEQVPECVAYVRAAIDRASSASSGGA